ncbi:MULTISPECIES: delta-60 repeat domain-containing protein [Deinococcus]|uniref:Delta-60 repeat domain-containing protein n=1 Tax=Deinococcus rufus TaxID=2136097 RepID=A0ABV7ZAM9_9DEIO|nr:delta-60 repeat domain-containing protein [Deinococcus sp. AB2017081]WQE94678.1 delta-60 repeat domain-containing protein [Deinococcus sp. AB2017081]
MRRIMYHYQRTALIICSSLLLFSCGRSTPPVAGISSSAPLGALGVKQPTSIPFDTTFDGDGIAVTPLGSDPAVNSSSVKAVQQADGRIVAATNLGQDDVQIAVVRYNANGSLDTSFGTGGQVIFNPTLPVPDGTPGADTVNDLLVQPDGRIVLVGVETSTGRNAVVYRLLPTGQLDPTFGAGGVARLEDGIAVQVLRLLDGSLLVRTGTALTKLTAAGTPDLTFGTSGTVTVSSNTQDLAVQSSGRILLGTETAILGLTPAGTPDPSFGTNGEAGFGSAAVPYFRFLVLPGDGIFVAADVYTGEANQGTFFRFTPQGTLDTTFGQGGTVAFDSSLGFSTLVLTPKNDVLIYPAIYDKNGKLKELLPSSTTFRDTGFSRGSAVTYQRDGKLLLPGNFTAPGSTTFTFAVARLRP